MPPKKKSTGSLPDKAPRQHKAGRNSPSILSMPMDVWAGSRIHTARRLAGYSLLQFERLTGINRAILARLEQAKSAVTAGRIHKISNAMGIPPTWFFEGAQKEPSLRIVEGKDHDETMDLMMHDPQFTAFVDKVAHMPPDQRELVMKLAFALKDEGEEV